MTTKVDVKNERYVYFKAWPVHINPKAHKCWVGRVAGYDPNEKYPVQLDWLDKEWLDNEQHYDVSNLVPGDFIKVNAGSHNNSYPQYFMIVNTAEDYIEIKKMEESEVIAELEEDKDGIQGLKKDVARLVARKNFESDEIGQEKLEDILKILNEDRA